MIAVDIYFKRKLSAEAHAEQLDRNAAEFSVLDAHEREAFFFEVDIAADLLQQVPAVWTDYGDGRKMICQRRQVDIQLGPFGLQPELEPAQHVGRTAGRRCQVKMLLPETRHDAIVHQHAVFPQHDAISTTADLHLGDVVRIDALEKLNGIRTANIDLTERRGVHDAERVTRRKALPGDCGVQVFTVAWEIPGSMPLADHFKWRPGRFMPLVNRRGSDRLKQIPDILTGNRTEGHRRVRGAKCRRTDLGNRFAQAFGQNRHAIDVAELALIGTEAQGRIAFYVFDIAVALANGEAHIGNACVILKIDKLL